MNKKVKLHDPNLALPVSREVELEGVALRSWSANFSADDVALPALPGRIGVEVDYKVRHDVSGDDDRLYVTTSFKVHGTDDETGQEHLRISCAFVLRYRLTNGKSSFNRDQYAAFAHLNGMVNAWPYFRELVHSTTSRMGLPPLMIPVFRVGSQAKG